MVQHKRKELLLKCVAIKNETADVKSFEFTSEDYEPIVFKPGQFVNMKFTIDAEVYNRCYTIASCPNSSNSIEIIIKRVGGGVVSNWLFDNFTLGQEIEALPPTGAFCLQESHKKKLLLLSAGSGITPMLSILRHIELNQLDYNVKFHHSARSQADLIAFNELSALSKTMPSLDLSFNLSREVSAEADSKDQPRNKLLSFCKAIFRLINTKHEAHSHSMQRLTSVDSEQKPGNDFGIDSKIFSGRISTSMLSQVCDDIKQRDVFVCGPEGFMSLAKQSLSDLRLPKAQYFQESFEFSELEREESNGDETFDIEFIHSKRKITVASNKTVLEAAGEVGIDLDFSCSSGICGSCTSYLIDGDVHAPQAQAIDAKDAARGEFLPCCSFARSDLVVDL